MSTNFYWYVEGGLSHEVKLPTGKTIEMRIDYHDPLIHIGKRSAAGLYCYKCGKTLCLDGEDGVHKGRSQWSDICVVCGAKKGDECIDACCSFNWAQDPKEVKWLCEVVHFMDTAPLIVNEYAEPMMGKEFLEMVNECPIHYYDNIGKWFS